MALTLLPTAAMAEGDEAPAGEGAGSAPVEAPAETKVAQIGDVKYDTLQAAIDAAKDGDTVRLLANVTLTETAEFPAGKKVDLNLKGHNITAEGEALRINGKTDIQSTGGTGTIESTGNVAVAVGNNAKVTVYSGTLKGREGAVITGTSTGATIEIRGSRAKLIATDNAVIAGNGSKRDGKPNTILVKGGTFIGGIVTTGYIACGIYAPWNDNVTVSGGTFNITNGAGIVARAGTVKVTGGTFNCSGNSTGWVGDNKNQIPCAALVFDAAANYPALTEDSKILVSGGSFSTDPAANGVTLADGYVAALNSEGMYKVGKENPVAEINGVKYDTLSSAIAAAEATEGGATIKLLKDISSSSTNYKVTGKVTIDLNGHNITASGAEGVFYVYVKGDLTIKGEGTVTAVEDNKAAMAVWVRSPIAKVTLEGGTYTQQITNTSDNHFDLIYVEYGTAYIKGGTYEGATPEWTLNCKDEHYQSKEANIEVTGGTFVGFDPANNKAEGVNTSFLPEGYTSTKNDDGTYTAKKVTYVARIGETRYETLTAAIAAAQNGETVTLLKDVTTNVTIPAGKTITLDLNGKTLNGGKNNGNAALLNKGTVTIKDSSATKTGTIKREDDADKTGTSYYVIKNLGTMTIEQANVINNSGYKKTNPSGSMVGSSLICNGDSDDDKETTLTINDGVFEQQNFLAVKNGTFGILNVNGGKFTSKHSAIQNWYKADIKGGEINGQLWTDAYTWKEGENGYSAGVTKISGATKFTGEIVMDITLYPGITKGKIPTLEISGGEMNVTNWRITSVAANAGAKPVITGGTFSSDPSAYVAAGHYVDASNNGDYPYIVNKGTKPAGALIVVKDKTDAAVSNEINDTDKGKIEAVKDKANVDGVAEAVDSAKKADIVAKSGTTVAENDKVEIEVAVKVEAKAADLANGKLTFEASPVATVKVNGAATGTTVPVTNAMLNDKPITVKLPLPTVDGKLFTPKQILHKFTGGGYEYFINETVDSKRGAGSFKIEDGCAVFTIYGFSTFELSGTVTYVEPSSGGGSSSSSRRYDVSAPSVKHGDVTVSPKSASKGDTVTITVKPDSGYEVDTLTVKDASGSKIKVKDKGDGKFTFTMPASKVTVSAEFAEIETLDFADVSTDAYYYEAVKWAAKKGITGGTGDGTFNPNGACTRAHIVTFLWRAAGSPEPKSTVSFADVPAGSYYAKAVAWAVENGITLGIGDGTFSPNATCTRAQSVTFLYRAMGTAPTTVNGFTDVTADAFYADAVAWAVESGVTNGTSASTFSPNNGCTRAQIVTFLYRTMK